MSTLARNALDQAAQTDGPIYIASITMVELAYLVERNRLGRGSLVALDAFLASGNSALSLVPLDNSVARALLGIPRNIVPDMPDRIITATGLYLNLPGHHA